MAVNTTYEIVQSYVGLLIMQYLGKPKAVAQVGATVALAIIPQISVQEITFSSAATSGAFTLSYGTQTTSSLAWNASTASIQTALESLTGLASVSVTGSLATELLTVTFTGVQAPALPLSVSSTLMASSLRVTVTIEETDETIPLAVQDAFNIIEGTALAQGVQLDAIGKYAGVTRTGFGFTQAITLDDTDFLSLIRMAVIKNSSGSSLATIQDFLQQFFAGVIYVFDHKDMSLTYIISAGSVSQDLLQLFITEGLLPSPMGVRTDEIYYVPTANLFGFSTYELFNTVASPFNTYGDYQTTWPWLSYHDQIG